MKGRYIFLLFLGFKLFGQTDRQLLEARNEACINMATALVGKIEHGIDTTAVILKQLQVKIMPTAV